MSASSSYDTVVFTHRVDNLNYLFSLISRRILYLQAHCHFAHKRVRASIKSDRQSSVDTLATNAQQCADASDFKGLYRCVRILGSQRKSCVLGVKLDNDKFAATAVDRGRRWQEYFSTLLNGEQSTIEEVQERLHSSNAYAFQQVAHDGFHLSNIPSFRDMCNLMSYCKRGRAHGEDGIAADALALAPVLSAMAFHSVFLKSIIRMEEPAAYRGGAVVNIWKGKACQYTCSNHRGVTVGDSVGKKLHTWYRSCLFSSAVRFASTLQCGGYKGRGRHL